MPTCWSSTSERHENIAGVAVQIDSYMAGVAVLDKEPEDGEDMDDANLLELWPLHGKESHTDVNISENLTYQQRWDIQQLIQEYADIFMESPGITQLKQHHIEMIMKDSIEVKSYLMPYAMREIIKEDVEAMLEADIIEPSTSQHIVHWSW